MTPTLSTGRLTLRALTKASARQVGWLQDHDVTRHSEQRLKEHSLHSQQRYIASFTGRSHIWGLYLVESGNHIGNLTASYDEQNNIADIGIMIGETSFWGRGYGFEAWLTACNWLLDRDGGNIRKLEAGCMRSNEAMAKIIRRAGFKQEGERLNHFLVAGAPISALLFGRHR